MPIPVSGAAVLPVLVLEVFSIELMLKCFLMHDGNHVPETHNIAELFRQLGSKRKRQIVKRWEDGPKKRLTPAAIQFGFPADLPNALERCANAFEKLRYIYEFPTGADFYLGELPRLLQELMAEVHPEWIVWIDVE